MTYSWLVENFTKDGKSTGLYMACQVNMTVTADVNAARKFRRQITAEFRALDMREARRGDWRAVEHGFDDSEPPNGPDERAAQPVAGAVAQPKKCHIVMDEGSSQPESSPRCQTCGEWRSEPCNKAQAAPAPEPSRLQKMREAGFTARDTRLTCDECGAKFTPQFAPLHECAQPEPSAQAVAELPDEIRVPLHRLWADAGYLIGRAKTGDTDLAVHTIKALCDELERAIRAALAASPQPEPSAQGEPVAWEGAEEWMPLAWELCADECGEEACTELVWEGGPIPEPWGDRWLKYEDEAKRLIALVRKYVPLASAPSTQPHAVVEAVPLEWPIERAADMLTAYAELVKATGRYAEEHYIPEIENVASELRGIAPKAAQEKPDGN